jgi:hypothetical protein
MSELEEKVMELEASLSRTRIVLLVLTIVAVYQLVDWHGPIRKSVELGRNSLSEHGLHVGGSFVGDEAVSVRGDLRRGTTVGMATYMNTPSLWVDAVDKDGIEMSGFRATVLSRRRTVVLSAVGHVSSELYIDTRTGAWTLHRTTSRDGKPIDEKVELLKPLIEATASDTETPAE